MSKTYQARTDDEDEIVQDGHSVRVRMSMMDEMQKEIRRTTAARITDANGNGGLALHRPGYRVSSSTQMVDRQPLYDAYDQMKADEWRGDATDETVGKQEGDSCTVRGLKDIGVCGSRGTLRRRVGGELVCVSSDQSSTDAKQDCYQQYDEAIQNAWRGGGR